MERRQRDELLQLPDAEFVRQCRVDCFRGTGHGGQKRNTTDSAVRVTHLLTDTVAACDDSRSQKRNRDRALERVRLEIARTCRAAGPQAWPERSAPGRRDGRYPLWVAAALDALHAAEYGIGAAAAHLGTNTGRLVRDLARDPALWQLVNQGRRARGLDLLRRS